jgi:uncharacterized protein
MTRLFARSTSGVIFRLATLTLIAMAWTTNSFSADDDLVAAAAKGDLSRIRALLEAGVDVNLKVPSGATALIAASQAGQSDAVRLLLGAKADVNAAANDGSSALIWASQGGYADVVQALLAGGPDVNAEDKQGRTALIGASYNGHLNVVKVLLAAKEIKPNAVTSTGASALEAATAGGHTEVRSLLVKAGATATPAQPATAQKDKSLGSSAEALKAKLAPPAGACFAVVQDVSSCRGLTCTPVDKKESLASCYSLSADRSPNFDDAFYTVYIASCHSGEPASNEIPLFGAETSSGNARYARGFSPPAFCRWRADPGTEPSSGVKRFTNITVGNDRP